jgi:hypothetical protein
VISTRSPTPSRDVAGVTVRWTHQAWRRAEGEDEGGERGYWVGDAVGGRQVEHFQWVDRAAYEAYQASDLGKAASSLLVTLHPQVFFLREMEVIV